MGRLLTGLALMVALAGCAVTPPADDTDLSREAAFAAHESQLRSLERWSLYARAAINTPEQSGTVSLFWRQRRSSYTLTLRAPFGAGTVRISGDGDTVTLQSSDGRRDRAATAAELVRRHTGYALPVAQLRFWVLGIAAPEAPRRLALTETGYIDTLEQSGWTLHFANYRWVDDVALPGTIRAQGQDIELKLAVQQWSVGSGE